MTAGNDRGPAARARLRTTAPGASPQLALTHGEDRATGEASARVTLTRDPFRSRIAEV